MLELMRRHAKSWIMKLLLFLIIFVFVLYFGSMRGKQAAEAIAKIDGRTISYAEYEKEYQDLIEVTQQRLKGMLTDELIKSLNLKRRALDNLIARTIIIHKADEIGIAVTDEEVRNSILAFPGFQRDGIFKEYLYRDLLQMNHMTPEEFEASHKQSMLVEKMREMIQSGVFVTDREVFDLYRIRNEKVKIQFVTIKAADMVKNMTPTDKDMEAFLKQNSERFRIPEQIQLRYLSFPAADAAATITLSEAEITDYINQQQDNWKKSNPSLTDVAVRNRALSELKQTRGMQAAAKKAKDAHDTIYQEENFPQFAAQNHYTVQMTDFFPLNQPPHKFANITDFTKKLLDLQKNELSPVMSDGNGYYVFQLVEKKPAHLPALKDIESRLKPIFIGVRSQRLAEEKAVSLLGRLQQGEDWSKVCAANGLKISETGFFLPGESIPQIGASQELSDTLLQLTANAPYPAKPFIIEGNAYIVRFAGRENINPVDYEARKDNLKRGLLRFKQEDVVRSWLEANKASMLKEGRLKINKDVKDL